MPVLLLALAFACGLAVTILSLVGFAVRLEGLQRGIIWGACVVLVVVGAASYLLASRVTARPVQIQQYNISSG